MNPRLEKEQEQAEVVFLKVLMRIQISRAPYRNTDSDSVEGQGLGWGKTGDMGSKFKETLTLRVTPSANATLIQPWE